MGRYGVMVSLRAADDDEDPSTSGGAGAAADERASFQAAEALYRGLFNQVAVGVARVTPDGRLVDVNQWFCTLVGYDRSELLGMSVADLSHPDDLATDYEKASSVLRGEIDSYALEKRYLVKGGGVVWVNLNVSLVRKPTGEPDFFVAVVEDITHRRAAEVELKASEARFRTLADLSPDAILINQNDAIVYVNRAALKLYGVAHADELLGHSPLEFNAPEHHTRVRERVARILSGEPIPPAELVIIRKDGARSTVEVSAGLIEWEGAPAVEVLMRDATERRLAEDRRRLLISELNHRVRNTLAVVQSIARQTFAGASADPEAKVAFEERLHALAAAHNILTRESWRSADLREVVQTAAGPQAKGRLDLEGPTVSLPPNLAVALSLALHELGTNASKYGALSSDGGRVQVSWRVARESRPVLTLCWSETGGPPVAAPRRRGFGTRMLERALGGGDGSSVNLQFRPDGLVCDLEVALDG